MQAIELGVMFTGMGWDLDGAEVRDWARGVEAIGYEWIGTNDHVAYAYNRPDREPGFYAGPVYQHETMTLLAHMAACTERVILQSCVLVLPQRQPALVAKQAAEIDVLSGGRFRLGVGMGWGEAEFESLGVPFRERVARFEEAIAVVRRCWGAEPVEFEGQYTTIRSMNMEPKPVTPGGPPIIIGGFVEAAERRAARLGDGWLGAPMAQPAEAAATIGRMRETLKAEGRDPERFTVQWMAPLGKNLDELATLLRGYRDAGASQLLLLNPETDPKTKVSVDAQLRQLEAVWREVRPAVVGG